MAQAKEQDLWDAIERNKSFILRQCHASEFDKQKIEDLYGEVICRIAESLKSFLKHESVNSDAWVKTVTANALSAYRYKQANKPEITNYENIDEQVQSAPAGQENRVLMRMISHYIKTTFSIRDQQIMELYFTRESHKNIAAIVQMEEKSVTNKISILKKQINEYINRGSSHE